MNTVLNYQPEVLVDTADWLMNISQQQKEQ